MTTGSTRLLALVLSGLLAGCAGTGGGSAAGRQLVLADDGQSEIEVGGGWETRPNISRKAQIRLADVEQDHYLLVNTYRPEESKSATLEAFAQNLSAAIFENLGEGTVSEARALKLGERPAVEYEMRTGERDDGIIYLSTVVQGQRARYHLLAWTSADGDVAALRRAVAGFRESATAREPLRRVTLEFNWPDRFKSQSSVHLKVNKRGEQYEMSGDMEASVRRISPEELLVSTRVLRHKMTFANAGKDKAKEEFLQGVLRASLTEVPDYVVNDDGELVRLENLPAYHRRVQNAILKALPAGGQREALERAREFVQSSLTEETLLTAFQEDWAESVGNWAGGAYVVGQVYRYTVPYRAPALGEAVFPMEVTQQLAGHAPCRAGAAPQSCVRLVQTSRVTGRDYTRAMDAYVRKTVGNGVRVEAMEVVNTVELLTDPRTLLPHASKTKESKRVTLSAEGKTVVNEDTKDETTTYRY